MNKCSLLLLLSAAVGCATVPKADRDLFAAIKEDNASEVERLVATGANVNAKHDQSYDGLPPLAWAGVWGSTKAADSLIAHGANVNGGNRYGSTPLHVAAYNQKPAMVALLVRKGGDVNVRTENGWTPLHKAMERLAMTPTSNTPQGEEVAKVVSVVELLLTPLHFLGVYMHDRKLAELLIQKGADVNASEQAGHTPLEGAVRAGNAEVAEVLRRHGGK